MRLIEEPLAQHPGLDHSVVTVGVFDGLHAGHRKLIAEARRAATDTGGPLVVVLFDRHPETVTSPSSAPRLLTDLRQRIDLLEQLGVDATYVLRFDEERSLEAPADFVRTLLSDTLGASTYVAGAGHHFGHRGKGNAELVTELGSTLDIKVIVVPLMHSDGAALSSTRIRGEVADGDVETAGRWLERPFELRGLVEHGDARGRTIGFPTANVAVAGDMALPANGVYAGTYVRPDGTEHVAAINLGRRPTFYDENGLLLVEAHLLDFDADLYDERPRVRFHHRLRDEVRFDGIDALKAQLAKDVERTRELLA